MAVTKKKEVYDFILIIWTVWTLTNEYNVTLTDNTQCDKV